MVRVIKDKMREEIVFLIVLVVALITSVFDPINLEVIEWHVVFILMNLMLLTLAFEKYGILDAIALFLLKNASSDRKLGFLLIFLTAGLAMFITNDVALITVVPITMNIGRQLKVNPIRWIVLETISANVGSSLTPFGNPQNLFLYSKFSIATLVFFKITALFVGFGLLLLFLLNLRAPKTPFSLKLNEPSITSKNKTIWMGFLFVLMIFSILRWIPLFYLTVIIFASFIILEIELFKKVDYFLLGTFICFFIAIDHLAHFEQLSQIIQSGITSKWSILWISCALSQVISNVPAAILMSGFTKDFEAILLGVSVGGMGTMVASMANLISFKFYIKQYPSRPYRVLFYKYNGLFLIVFMLVFWILVKTGRVSW
ncbi:SLC13 family permease [Fusibacter sp. 3D3]|uniref:SLC13 family permease n=1 Tax=Fusibacter sp. 3D3 TaxID=1048380 RepID=UPI000852D4C4|nr:SLC13 family permease [Fusibacter sp. 3D3]GAU79157.1 anion permease ArsB/NhaD-like [Fusibacter sp. 3D3]